MVCTAAGPGRLPTLPPGLARAIGRAGRCCGQSSCRAAGDRPGSSWTTGPAGPPPHPAPLAPPLTRGLCPPAQARSKIRDGRPMEARVPRPTLGRRTEIMSADTNTTSPAAADAAAAPLDLLLTDAAVGMLRRVNPGGSGLRLAAALASRPRLIIGHGRQLLGELARIAAGVSEVQPSRRDRRFADPGWAGNPLLHRAMQTYLATARTAEGVVADVGLDPPDSAPLGFLLT